jgi:hypothetical protein
MAAEGIKSEHIDDVMSAEALTVAHLPHTTGASDAALTLEPCNSGFGILHNFMSDLMETTLRGGSGASCTLASDSCWVQWMEGHVEGGRLGSTKQIKN